MLRIISMFFFFDHCNGDLYSLQLFADILNIKTNLETLATDCVSRTIHQLKNKINEWREHLLMKDGMHIELSINFVTSIPSLF